MGKTQKKRAIRRHNPVRVPDSHLQHGLATAAASTPSTKRDAVLPVIEKVCALISSGIIPVLIEGRKAWEYRGSREDMGMCSRFESNPQ